MSISLLLVMLAQDARPIPMGGLPQPPAYETTTRVACGAGRVFVIKVENRGLLHSKLLSSTMNGQAAIFRSMDGELGETLQRLTSVSVQPAKCGSDGMLTIAIRGVDADEKSSTSGKEVLHMFRSAGK